VLQAGRAVVAEEAPGLLMQYVHVPCHLTMRPPVVEQALAVVLQQVVWVQVSVAQVDWRA
jgi:hypothetical protein